VKEETASVQKETIKEEIQKKMLCKETAKDETSKMRQCKNIEKEESVQKEPVRK
jgi:hypothetical protein